MKLKSLTAAVALAATALTSNVASADTLTLTPNASFSHTVAAGLFSDVWTFNLGSSSTVATSLTNVEINFGSFLSNSITGFAASLNGTALSYSNGVLNLGGGTAITTQVLSGAGVYAPGAYTLTVSGTAGMFGASYGGNIVAVPVPEPESYAMLLAGLGLMGTIARRRSKSKAV